MLLQKKAITIIIALILLMPIAFAMKLERLSFESEVVEKGDYLVTTADITNPSSQDIMTSRFTIIIPELGLRKSVPFTVKNGDSIFRRAILDIQDDIAPGDYIVRAVISSDHSRRVRHRYITIV